MINMDRTKQEIQSIMKIYKVKYNYLLKRKEYCIQIFKKTIIKTKN